MNEPVVRLLAKRLAAKENTLCAWVGMNEPAVAELLAREGFDAVMLDMQHGAVDFAGASRSILSAALAGCPSIVRVAVGEFAVASRLVDAGSSAILAPMINSRADAERLVEFVKFPPIGRRSWGPRAALALSGYDASGYLKSANVLVQAIAMIETRDALDALDDILAVEGVDGVFVGPSDLSVTLSGGATVEPRGEALMHEAKRVVERANAHDKYAGMFCFDGTDACAMLALGFRLCSVGTDQTLLRGAARAELKAARGHG